MKSDFIILCSVFLTLFQSCVKTKTISTELPYDVIVDGIAYNLSYSTYSASVTGKQEPSSYKGQITIPSIIEYNSQQYKVTDIGEEAFYESGISAITLPPSIMTIGQSAFYGCKGLESIIIPASIETIKDNVFEWSGLKKITIEDSYESIDVMTGLNQTPIENAYVGRSLTGNWEASHLDFLMIGQNVKEFTIKLNQPLEITCLSVNPPMLNVEADEEVFKNSIVYVPGTAVQDYMANEYWKQFEIILTKDSTVSDWDEVPGENFD